MKTSLRSTLSLEIVGEDQNLKAGRRVALAQARASNALHRVPYLHAATYVRARCGMGLMLVGLCCLGGGCKVVQVWACGGGETYSNLEP